MLLMSEVQGYLAHTKPTAFVLFLNSRKRRPTGFACGFLRVRRHRPTDLRVGVFLAEVPLYESLPNEEGII